MGQGREEIPGMKWTKKKQKGEKTVSTRKKARSDGKEER
jgi:hypothetical protein